MAQSISVLLLDDGELDDIQKMLEQLRVPFGRIRGASIVPGMQGPTDLLIATPRRVGAIRRLESTAPNESAPVRIVVANEDSTTLRDRLRSGGFEFLVRRPVHPEALRLLVLHALYTGEERRREPRIPMGYEITFKCGLRQRRGLLADISISGCRLLADGPLEDGRRLRIDLPEEIGASEPISLRGRVLWSRYHDDLESDPRHVTAVLFEKISGAGRRELESILAERANGSGLLGAPGASEAVPLVKGGIREIPPRNLRSDPRFEPNDASDPPAAPAPQRVPRKENTGRIQREITPLVEATARLQKPEAPETSGNDSAEPHSSEDRRKERRAAFSSKVPAFCSRALRVLIGRDITIHGMRIEASAELAVGARLHLAIYGDPGEEPFLVWAKVARDDDDRGMLVEFDPVHEVVGRQLEKLVASLPAVESLQDGEIGAMGTVISEILADSDD